MEGEVLLRGGQLIDVSSGTVRPGDLILKGGRILGVGSPGACRDEGLHILDVSGRFVAPGFIESHMHVESTLLSLEAFTRKVLEHGTTTLLVDPHEMANVFGRRGIELFLERSERLPLDLYVGVSSCVPSSPLEDSPARITVEDVRELISHPLVYGLAEMMNVPAILKGSGDAREKVDLVYDYGKIVDGHCPGLQGRDLITYVTNGKKDGRVRIMSDHESEELEEALAKHRAGMTLALRYGGAMKDLDRILPGLVTRGYLDSPRFVLCSDDLDPVTLRDEGHMDRILRRAGDIILENADVSPAEAILSALTLATVNPAAYLSRFLRLHGHPGLGDLSPGSRANLVVLDSLESMRVEKVLYAGRLVVDGGRYVGEDLAGEYGDFTSAVRLGRTLTAGDFEVRARQRGGKQRVRVIEVRPGYPDTRWGRVSLPVSHGQVLPDPEQDVAKVAVFERHRETGLRAVGFVRGLGIRKGAVASTVAHDSHNLLIAGSDDPSMVRAGRALCDQGGGMYAATDGEDFCLPLRIGGLMSEEPAERVADAYERLHETARKTGSGLSNLFLTMSFLSLPVIPEARITPRGLVDVSESKIVDLC